MTNESTQWYLCDAKVNVICPKTHCYLAGDECRATSNPNYAFKSSDGEPFKVKWINDEMVVDYD